MIISKMGGFLIATPTKCGTTTLESIANRHTRESGTDEEFSILDAGHDADDTRRRQHRMTPPDGMQKWPRYMLVRHPYSRMTSVYEYLRAPANYSQWGAREVQGREWPGINRNPIMRKPMSFPTFLAWLRDERFDGMSEEAERRRGPFSSSRAYRSPWVWTDSLGDSYDFWHQNKGEQPVTVLRLESLWDDLDWLLRKHEMGRVADTWNKNPLHSNRSTNKKHADWRDYFTKPYVRKLAQEMGLHVDADLFGYAEIPG